MTAAYATKEDEAVQALAAIGIQASEKKIRDTLRKHNGDLDATASALISELDDPQLDDIPPLEDFADSRPVPRSGAPPPTPRASPRRVNSPVQPKPVIDLTGDSDDEELQKALSLSVSPHVDGEIGDTGSGNSFKKSERTDVDQSWALVPVSSQNNDTTMTTAQDDDLQRAMEASLNSSYNEHSDELWVPGRTRLDKTCIPIPDGPVSAWAAPAAIRASNGRLQFAALLIQALYAVPQLRDRLMEVTLDPCDPHGRLVFNEGQNDHVRHFFELQRVFCMLDYTQRAHIEIDYLLPILECQVPTRIQKPEKQSLDLLNNVCDSIESALMAYYAVYQIKRLPTLTTHFIPRSPPVFHILLKPTQYRNDLHSCLQYFFTEDIQHGSQKGGKAKANATLGGCRFMHWPTPVLIFRLFRDPHEPSAPRDIKSSTNVSATTTTAFVTTAPNNSSLTPGSGPRREKPQPEPFKFPSALQMDRWHVNNAEATNQANYEIRQLRSKAVELEGKLARLLTHNDHDNLANLQSALYYVENIASRDTEERKAAHATASSKLRAIIERIQQEIQKTKDAIRYNLEEQSRIYEETTGELDEEYRYQLRAVLMHNGSYGPKNVYAYVKSSSGEWWKSVYDVVTKVTEETVLTDRAGLYLNSGPYMLFYSRVTPELEIDGETGEPSWPYQAIPPVDMKLSWPSDFLSVVEEDNENLRKELARQMRDNELKMTPNTLTIEELAKLDKIPEGIEHPARPRPPPSSDFAFSTDVLALDHDPTDDLEPPIEVLRPGFGVDEIVNEEEAVSPAPSMQVSDTEMELGEETTVAGPPERAGSGSQP